MRVIRSLKRNGWTITAFAVWAIVIVGACAYVVSTDRRQRTLDDRIVDLDRRTGKAFGLVIQTIADIDRRQKLHESQKMTGPFQ
jgi:hypothetical protein